MSRPTTPRPMILALATLLLAALATPSCSLLSKPSSGPSPSGGGSGPAQPAANSGGTSETAASPAGVQVVDSDGLRDLGAQEATIVDVRTKDDFELEHLPDAVNVPMSEFTKKAAKWAEDEALVVYGSKDAKAQTAASWLVRNGFQQVYRLKGGIEEWDGERDGPLSKCRLDKPTVVLIYVPAAPMAKEIVPEVEQLKKHYEKKADFMLLTDDQWLDVAQPPGEKLPETPEKAVYELTYPFLVAADTPAFVFVDVDPRVYRRVDGYAGLRVLYSWLQEQ